MNIRTKHHVKIRERKLVNGRKSLYLDIYMKGKRKYVNLGLVLKPDNGHDERHYNREIIKIAELRRTDYEMLLLKNRLLWCNVSSNTVTLSGIMQMFREKKELSGHSVSLLNTIDNTLAHLLEYSGRDMFVTEIDKDFILGFIKYLVVRAKELRHGGVKVIKKSTAKVYLRMFAGCLKMAFIQRIITHNPWEDIETDERRCLSGSYTRKVYLTIEEIKRLINTPLKNKDIKNAFLFACFTGLRISDINNLRWKDVIEQPNGKYLNITTLKTKAPIIIKLCDYAERIIGKSHDTGKIFNLPQHLSGVNPAIKSWTKKAGIDKKVTFHCSRHTFATLQLTLGTDIYVVSKLLGHKSILTTQIYADIIDEKKDKAIDLINQMFND